MSEDIRIGGINLFDMLKDMGFEDVKDEDKNKTAPPFLVRDTVDWNLIQKLSVTELKDYLVETRFIEQDSIIYKTLHSEASEFIILYGYEYDPFYVVATIIAADSSYNHASIAGMERQNESVFILDIKVRNKDANKGYGSLLLEQLKTNAISKGKYMITGDLTPEDLRDHGDRLIHFYRKHGFEIEEFGHYAKIKWTNPDVILNK
ncbi:hypothetical protein [Brevibacillus reuszeri]|uniref:hypothetical protein n=1 Tax=Brevibacillus reuszeri TaxID=54915 RepID=UPI003D1B985B